MTLNTTTFDYLERPYLNENDPYLTGAMGAAGMQATFVIDEQTPVGMQSLFTIEEQSPYGMQATFVIDEQVANAMQSQFVINADLSTGMQSEFNIVDFADEQGMQAEFVIDDQTVVGMEAEFTIDESVPTGIQAEFITASFPPYGMQSEFTVFDETKNAMQSEFVIDDARRYAMQAHYIIDQQTQNAMQALFEIVDHAPGRGMEAKFDKLFHHLCAGYLEAGYLEDPYLTPIYCAMMGMQAEFNLFVTSKYGMQAEFFIEADPSTGMQSEFTIDKQVPSGMQSEFTIKEETPKGMQSQFVIDKQVPGAMQALFIIDKEVPVGMQTDFVRNVPSGMQALFALYNTTNLRILCEFPSRGAATTGGTNAWGNPIGQGLNWQANSTEPGDFESFRLNTDVVEEYWRSATGTKTGINLDCDTEIAQGVFLDTLAIMGHNLTTSATVQLIGSNVSNFSVIGTTITPILTEENTYWVAPTLPNMGFRYWRLQIDDPTNPEDFIKIGTIVFGAAKVFQGECFVDQVEFELKDFADTVNTEGHTNVSNSRALKRVLRLDFQSLKFNKSNFRILRDMFQTERTVLKCLWIPTPHTTDAEYLGRFTVFSKLVKVPTERHNVKGVDSDYVSLSIELDESL